MTRRELRRDCRCSANRPGSRNDRAALRLLNRYSFGFALLLALALLVTTLIRQGGNFGWSDQLANFAPLAIAAMASTPAIISGGGGFDLSISPLMFLCGEMFIVWLAPHGLGGAEAVPIVLAVGPPSARSAGSDHPALRVPPVVATLSMYFILIGVDLRVAPSPTYLSFNWVTDLAGHVGPIPGALFLIGVPDRGLVAARSHALPAHALRGRHRTTRPRSRAASTSRSSG